MMNAESLLQQLKDIDISNSELNSEDVEFYKQYNNIKFSMSTTVDEERLFQSLLFGNITVKELNEILKYKRNQMTKYLYNIIKQREIENQLREMFMIPIKIYDHN
jgi:hypothetical protein